MTRIRRRLTYANIVASLALFLAMGGTGYAALSLPKASVGAKQLKQGAVTSKKVKNRSLIRKDFRAGQLPAGPQGPTGPQGATGEPGSAAAYALIVSNGTVFSPASKNVTDANVAHTTGSGVYCISGLPFAQRSAMATLAIPAAGGEDTIINISSTYSGPECPDSFVKRTTMVTTWDLSVGGPADRSFDIWFED